MSSVIQQNIASLKNTHPAIYEKYKNYPKELVAVANGLLVPAKDPEMTALEELEAPRGNNFLKGILSDPTRGEVIDQQKKDAEDFGEDYALDQRAQSLAAISRAEKDPFTTRFDDGNVVPPVYNEPLFYNNPEANDYGQLSKAKEPALLADFTSPMPTGARLDPYMDIPKVGQDDPIDDMVAGENLYPYTPTPDGHHRMPDGSIMPDSAMKGALGDPYDETPPVLREALGDPYDETFETGASGGVLGNNNDPKATPKAILDTTSSNDRKGSAVSSNARGSMMPFAKINRNEALMRIGGAIVGGSSQGFSGAMKAATDEFGNIQDANRQAETDAFNKAEATRLAEERIAALKAKGSAKDTNQNQETSNLIGDRISDFESGLQAIADSKAAGGNLTGVGGVFKSFFDNFSGDADAARRLLLKRLQVNDTLLRTAETKGAISNYEMALFKSPTPTNFMDEKIWSEWINARLNALRNQQYRLKNGIVLPESEQSYEFRSRSSDVKKSTTNNDALYNEADAIIG